MTTQRPNAQDGGAPRGDRAPARLVDWLFRNRQTGQMTVAQFPNLAMWGFLVFLVLSWVLPSGSTAHSAARGVCGALLAWWGIDELARGVNPWRRVLGGGAVVWVGVDVALRLN